jgi:uncharacterized membrane protein
MFLNICLTCIVIFLALLFIVGWLNPHTKRFSITDIKDTTRSRLRIVVALCEILAAVCVVVFIVSMVIWLLILVWS